MTFGEHIRQWREERELGLRQFAQAAGVSPTFVSKMERGIGPVPGEETIRKMAQILGKDPDVLLALADKVAADVLAVIIKQLAYARFLRENRHLTKDQWDSLSQALTHFGAKSVKMRWICGENRNHCIVPSSLRVSPKRPDTVG